VLTPSSRICLVSWRNRRGKGGGIVAQEVSIPSGKSCRKGREARPLPAKCYIVCRRSFFANWTNSHEEEEKEKGRKGSFEVFFLLPTLSHATEG